MKTIGYDEPKPPTFMELARWYAALILVAVPMAMAGMLVEFVKSIFEE